MGPKVSVARPRVSVIMPAYNAERFIREALDSVLAQTYTDYEIIVVNDGSKDSTLSILKEYKRKYPKKFRYFSQKNAGISAARNRAIASAHLGSRSGLRHSQSAALGCGDLIAFIDHDDTWSPDKLARQVPLFGNSVHNVATGSAGRRRGVGLVYSNANIIDSAGNFKKLEVSYRRFHRGNIFHTLLKGNFIPMSSVIVSKAALDEVGWFDASYKMSEEYDLWLRILAKHTADYVPAALASYRVHGGNMSRHVEKFAEEDIRLLKYWLARGAISKGFFRRRVVKICAKLAVNCCRSV